MIGGCSGADQGEREVLTAFGEHRAIDAFKNATSFAAYRISAHADAGEHVYVNEYDIISQTENIDDDYGHTLQNIMLNGDSYSMDSPISCSLQFSLGIRCFYDEDTVDILICFNCDAVNVYYNGEFSGGGILKSGRRQLLAIAKNLYPDDPLIQKLR